jgi:CubicO group peptidase (beta-lactamase class C family)
MIKLSKRMRLPASVFAELRQRHDIRHHLPQWNVIADDARLLRPQSGHHAAAARIADRILHIRPLKSRAASSQPVEVRRLHDILRERPAKVPKSSAMMSRTLGFAKATSSGQRAKRMTRQRMGVLKRRDTSFLKLAELDAAVTQAVSDGMIVGAAVWVERNGVSHHKAFGYRSIKPTMEPMTEDTIFDVASVTKAVATASAAMLCLERGLIQLDDPVSRHLPEFTGEGREKITIKHLLLHSSGLQVNLNGTKAPFSRTPAEAYAQACREKPLFEPGSAFSYSSVGSMVLGMVIEKRADGPLMRFAPLKSSSRLRMHDTQFRPLARPWNESRQRAHLSLDSWMTRWPARWAA